MLLEGCLNFQKTNFDFREGLENGMVVDLGKRGCFWRVT